MVINLTLMRSFTGAAGRFEKVSTAPALSLCGVDRSGSIDIFIFAVALVYLLVRSALIARYRFYIVPARAAMPIGAAPYCIAGAGRNHQDRLVEDRRRASLISGSLFILR